jgi:7-keto-8-aminopelargonate synthetase-like enzyme
MGLIGDPRIDGAAIEAIRMYGTDGARLLTGTTDQHLRMEHELTTFRGTEAALTFSSGYARCCRESGRQEGP